MPRARPTPLTRLSSHAWRTQAPARLLTLAAALGLSPTTVAAHVAAVYRKLEISSRAEVTVGAIRLGPIRP